MQVATALEILKTSPPADAKSRFPLIRHYFDHPRNLDLSYHARIVAGVVFYDLVKNRVVNVDARIELLLKVAPEDFDRMLELLAIRDVAEACGSRIDYEEWATEVAALYDVAKLGSTWMPEPNFQYWMSRGLKLDELVHTHHQGDLGASEELVRHLVESKKNPEGWAHYQAMKYSGSS